jgi:2-methylcitrate dehydratase PrpD
MTRAVADFVLDLDVTDLPAGVIAQARRCLLDLAAVAVSGSATPLSRLARDHAAEHLATGPGPARLFLDGRRVGPVGAAFANAATIDAMDAHDGHALAKGHAGAAVLPAATALLDPIDATTGELLATLVVGYEIALRAALTLHSTASDYHSSGAWNALGAAAVGARLLRLGPTWLQHALGIAEYCAPRAPMMRGIDHPTMVKDSSAWGAQAGVSSALLARQGFTGAPAALLDERAEELWSDLGGTWRILEQYFKPYPVCRWAQPAVHAVLGLRNAHELRPPDIDHIEVTTFRPATRLAVRHPETTEQAQYSLPFPVAVAAVRGALHPGDIATPMAADPQVRRLAAGMEVDECADMTARFPAERRAEVVVVLADGRRLSSGSVQAVGDPDQPLADDDLDAKFHAYAEPVLGPARTARLHALVSGAGRKRDDEVAALLDELTAPPRRETGGPAAEHQRGHDDRR